MVRFVRAWGTVVFGVWDVVIGSNFSCFANAIVFEKKNSPASKI